ncbi:MAG: hypothetical protein OXL68_13415 [Paracoccaceae bacterium]|nr:hypothetical protein [Paracoccaceae bacterium]
MPARTSAPEMLALTIAGLLPGLDQLLTAAGDIDSRSHVSRSIPDSRSIRPAILVFSSIASLENTIMSLWNPLK